MSNKPIVYYVSTETPTLKREYSLAAKFDAIVERLQLKDFVKNKEVAIKMHTGYKLNYTTLHPFLVGRVVQTILNGGGNPYIIDIPRQVKYAKLKGYTEEVLGCPVMPVAGIKDNYFVEKKVDYKGITSLQMGGNVKDADILVNLVHFKGHNSTGYGGAIKNLALGCFTQDSRYAMHDTVQYDSYWNSDKCKDPKNLIASCPYNLIKSEKGRLKVSFGLCNQCMRCIKADEDGCLQINQRNFESFFEVVAIAAKLVLDEVGKDNIFNITSAFNITEYCDCWGFTTGNILPDIGFLGSRDILAIDKAVLDLSTNQELILENISKTSDVNDDTNLHQLARIHGPYKDPYLQIKYGEKHNLGEVNYVINEILPAREITKIPANFPNALNLYKRIE